MPDGSEGGQTPAKVGMERDQWGPRGGVKAIRCGNLKASVRALAFAPGDSREPCRALGREVTSSNSRIQTMTLAAERRTDQGGQGKTPPGGECQGTQMVWTRQMPFHPGPQDSPKGLHTRYETQKGRGCLEGAWPEQQDRAVVVEAVRTADGSEVSSSL